VRSENCNFHREAAKSAKDFLYKNKKTFALFAASRWILALAFLVACVAACKKSSAPQRKAAPARASETPIADKAIAVGEAEEHADPSWLVGTWQERDKNHWFLFNLPTEAAELSGKPARVVRRGKLVVHGRYVSVVFSNTEVHFEASHDHSEMRSDAPIAVYRRGSPP